MRRSIPFALSTLSLITSTALAPVEALAASSRTATYKGATYVSGPGWGDIAVTIQVQGKKLTSLTATLTHDSNPHSTQLNQYAFPVLKKEALKSGSYKISTISGATQSSAAFVESLRSALTKAHI